MKVYHNLIQGTPEWHAVRSKKFTASNGDTIAVAKKGLSSYVNEIIFHCYVEPKSLDHIHHVMRGKKLEPLARTKFEMEKGLEITEVGFIDYHKYAGGSPDGLIYKLPVTHPNFNWNIIESGIEIKAKSDKNHLSLLLGTDKVDHKTWSQIQMNMMITKAKNWWFVSYNPNFKKSLYTDLIYPDYAFQDKLKKGVAIGTMWYLERIKNKNIFDEIKHDYL